MDLKEWREYQFNVILHFKDFWLDMNSYWPSSFPLNMDKDRWNIELDRWLKKGKPSMVSGSSYFDDK